MHTIHRLTPADLPVMRELLAVFGEAFDEIDAYTGAPPRDDYLRRLLARDHFVALAAVADGAVVGGLAAYELPKFERERSELYIYDLAVAEPHRRRGIATRLIGRLKEIAAERGAWVVFVQADHGDAAAIALYSELGMREEVFHFDIGVD